jgi:hypothetical protein
LCSHYFKKDLALREFDAPNMPDLKKISAPMCQLSAGAKKAGRDAALQRG